MAKKETAAPQSAAEQEAASASPGQVQERRGPLSALPRFEQELERLFGNHRPWRFDWPSDWPLMQSKLKLEAPSVDIIERDNEVVVKAELPGFQKEEIDVTLADTRMTIKASSVSETEDEDGDYHRREISRGYVSRTVTLPTEVVSEEAKAQLSDGVLEVTIPKAAKSKRQSVVID